MNWFKDKFEYLSSVKWGAYGIGVSFLKQLCLLPAFLYTVGDYHYSLWIFLTAVSILLGSISLGHFHYCSNYFNLAYHKEKDVEPAFRSINTANLIYVGLQILMIVFLFLPAHSTLFPGFSSDIVKANQGVLCLVALSLSKVLMSYSGMFLSRLLEPLGRIRQTLKLQALADFIDFVVTLVTILATSSLFTTCIAVLISSALFFAFVLLYVQRYFSYSLFSVSDNLKDGVLFVKQSLVLNTSFFLEKIYEQGIHLVVICMFSASVLPVFNSTRTVSNIFFRFSLIAILPLFPVIQKYYALKNYGYVITIFKKFWVISALVIIALITVGYPFLPYAYKVWTKGNIAYNDILMGSLFIGVLFQNFASVGYEFFKKVNYSLYILSLNVLRVLCMCVCMYAFGRMDYLPGIGFSFSIAEFICSLCSILFLKKVFGSSLEIRSYMIYMLPFVLFSGCLGISVLCNNYMPLFAGAVISFVICYCNFNALSKP